MGTILDAGAALDTYDGPLIIFVKADSASCAGLHAVAAADALILMKTHPPPKRASSAPQLQARAQGGSIQPRQISTTRRLCNPPTLLICIAALRGEKSC